MQHLFYVLRQHIHLEVDNITDLQFAVRRLPQGGGNEGDLEPILPYSAHRQRRAIDRDGALFHHILG